MSEKETRQQQEWEFVMEGITTRMQMAMDKLSDNNKALRETMRSIVKWVCIFSLVMTLLTVAGLILNNRMWITHEKAGRQEAGVREVIPDDKEIPQLGSGADD